jgi:DNA-binding transcriptional MerR regulator
MVSSPQKQVIPDKVFYKIGEISEITKIEPYVLRYWESEFSFLKPRKNKAGQRIYSRKDLELIIQIRDLLYKERYTIEGVKRKFKEQSFRKNFVSIETIQNIKKRLKEILKTLK